MRQMKITKLWEKHVYFYRIIYHHRRRFDRRGWKWWEMNPFHDTQRLNIRQKYFSNKVNLEEKKIQRLFIGGIGCRRRRRRR